MKNRIKPLILILLLVSCNPSETKKANLTVLAQQVIGTFEGSLPCADCVSIEYQLEILPDSTYVEHVTYLGRENGLYEVHGNWTLTEDSILSAKSALEGSKLLVRSDGTLQIIETNGTRSSVLERAGKSSNQQTLLNDIWVLETLHKKELTSQHFSKERPRLEFHNADNKVLGFGGCNQLTGEFITEGNQITITRIASTRMACSGINESLFLEIIQQASSFKIISGKLYLFEGSGELARFKKVD